jgi:hypothetical protein
MADVKQIASAKEIYQALTSNFPPAVAYAKGALEGKLVRSVFIKAAEKIKDEDYKKFLTSNNLITDKPPAGFGGGRGRKDTLLELFPDKNHVAHKINAGLTKAEADLKEVLKSLTPPRSYSPGYIRGEEKEEGAEGTEE